MTYQEYSPACLVDPCVEAEKQGRPVARSAQMELQTRKDAPPYVSRRASGRAEHLPRDISVSGENDVHPARHFAGSGAFKQTSIAEPHILAAKSRIAQAQSGHSTADRYILPREDCTLHVKLGCDRGHKPVFDLT